MQTGDPRLDAAILIAREAGALALRWQAGDLGPLATQQKPDDAGPVTRGDRETEELIVKRLQALFPSDDIVGEETGHHRGDPTHRWFIDPIDGTRDYAAGGN
ncbi:MAG: inositol monophosphatase family protein, partial [Nannocystaceae bacterium]